MYKKNVMPFLKQFYRLKINNSDFKNLNDFAFEISKQKKDEHFKLDNDKIQKRFLTGLLGERALEIFLDLDIINYNIGLAKDFNIPDIEKYNLGIKTVEFGKYPIIFKKNYYPQIINLVEKEETFVLICGLATTQMLNEFQDEELVLNFKLKERGTKTGYYNFKDLIPAFVIRDWINAKR